MAVPKANVRAVNKYIAKAYDRINLTLPKGSKEEVETHAANMGESVNAFIRRAIDEAMERDNVKRARAHNNKGGCYRERT